MRQIKSFSCSVSVVFLLGLWLSHVYASIWVNYSDPRGSLTMTDVSIPYETLHTYYCLLQWNAGQEAGGYAGVQRGGGGYNKHVHFSLWNDHSGSQVPIEEEHNYNDEVEFVPFGGEGTGMKSMWPFEWELDEWYTMVVKVWGGEDCTHFGMWFRDIKNDHWRHIFSMVYPVEGVTLSSIGGFLENFGSGGSLTRAMYLRNGYKLTPNGWYPYDQARLPGEVKDNTYFMEEGTGYSKTTLNIDIPEKPVTIAQIPKNFQVFISGGKFQTSWEVDATQSPPFSYALEIYNNPQFSGSPVYSNVIDSPDATSDLGGNAGNDDYYGKLIITDIFEETSVIYSIGTEIKPFKKEPGLGDFALSNFSSSVVISYNLKKTATVQSGILDIKGRKVTVFKDNYVASGNNRLQYSISHLKSGIYFFYFQIGTNIEKFKFIKL